MNFELIFIEFFEYFFTFRMNRNVETSYMVNLLDSLFLSS